MEALGTAILEASACGIPCVGSRVGGIPECIQEGKTGLLFESGEVTDLRKQLLTLCENQPLREEMGVAARTFVCENFSNACMIAHTEALYESL